MRKTFLICLLPFSVTALISVLLGYLFIWASYHDRKMIFEDVTDCVLGGIFYIMAVQAAASVFMGVFLGHKVSMSASKKAGAFLKTTTWSLYVSTYCAIVYVALCTWEMFSVPYKSSFNEYIMYRVLPFVVMVVPVSFFTGWLIEKSLRKQKQTDY